MRSLPAQLLLFAIILGGFLAIISAFVISVNLLGDPSSQLTVFLILKIVIVEEELNNNDNEKWKMLNQI